MSEQKRSENKSLSLKVLLAFLPLIAFLGLAVIFYKQLAAGGSTSDIPSALIGKNAPVSKLEPLVGLKAQSEQIPSFTNEMFIGKVSIVNVFASWCAPCRAEHPQLIELAKDDRIQVFGLNYKDTNDNALRFLGQLGNPYSAVGIDPKGRAAIEWGVYGVPETFIVGPTGLIEFKHVGPISREGMVQKILPAIERILNK